MSVFWEPRPRLGEWIAGVKAPAFIERARPMVGVDRLGGGIAGVKAPAFIERRTLRGSPTPKDRIAGVKAPAFIERLRRAS